MTSITLYSSASCSTVERVTHLATDARSFLRIYAELYGALLRVPGVRFVASGYYGASVPMPLPGSEVYRVCAELRRDAVAGRLALDSRT